MTDLDDVRRIALALPATAEKLSYGTPAFTVTSKLFARMREMPDVLVLWCGPGEKEALIASEPAKFFTIPHYDGYDMILVRLPEVDVDELAELVTESWRHRAPEKLAATLGD